MIEIRQTQVFSKWLRGLRDRQARERIQTRIDRLQLGLAGDVNPVVTKEHGDENLKVRSTKFFGT